MRTHHVGCSTHATPVELRKNLNQAVRTYRSEWYLPSRARRNARRIVLLVRKHPWLLDQVPWDVFDLAKKDAKQ